LASVQLHPQWNISCRYDRGLLQIQEVVGYQLVAYNSLFYSHFADNSRKKVAFKCD